MATEEKPEAETKAAKTRAGAAKAEEGQGGATAGSAQQVVKPEDMPFEDLLKYYRANAAKNNWGFDPIIIIGPTGSGKSSSIENLPPQLTFILNAEEQPLPFRGANRFTLAYTPKPAGTAVKRKDADGNEVEKKLGSKYTQIADMMRWAFAAPAPITILDSLVEMQNRCGQECEVLYQGFDRMSNYNSRLGEILDLCRTPNKFTIVFTHPENLSDVQGQEQTVAITQGKVWKGRIESKFTIALYAMTVPTEDGTGVEYKFLTNKTAGHALVSAKSPRGMFDIFEPNDLTVILRKLMLYRMGV